MNIFKNKYYKIFPLSIFITKCDEETVTFKNEKSVNIYTTNVIVEKDGGLKEVDTELFHNRVGYTIKKKFDRNNIIKDFLIDNKNIIRSVDDISKALENHVCAIRDVKNQDGNIVENYKLYTTDGFNADYFFYLYFFKIINNKVSLCNLKGQKIDLDEVNEKKDLGNIARKDDFPNKGTYCAKIYFILKELFPKIKSDGDCIISIDGTNLKASNNYNLNIYKNFIKNLQDDSYGNDKKIKIVLDDYYNIEIKDVLLHKMFLSKIYKITNDKKNEIKNILNGNYESYKYSSLQEKLNKEKVSIINGKSKADIEDLKNVTITITADSDEKYITPKQCTIEFKAGNNLYITDIKNYPAKQFIKFSKGGITTDTNIENYINTTYDKIKNNCIITSQGGNSGKFEDGTIVTVTINAEIDGITSKKDPNKVYVKVQIKVSDDSKFRFKGKLATSNNFDLEFDKDKKITDLLNEITKKLDNTDLKDGYNIELNNSAIVDKETTLVPDANYVITLADNDPNFVEEIKQTPIDKPIEKPGDTDKAKKDVLINECNKLLSDIKNLDSSYNEPINNDDTIDNLNKLKDKLTSKLNDLKNKKPENNNNNDNNDNTNINTDTTTKNKKGYSGKKKDKNTKKNGKCC